MSFKHRAFDAINRRSTRWLIGLVATAVAALEGQRARITYDAASGGWLKHTSGGVTLMPYPHGMGMEQCADFSRDVFLRDYTVGPGDVILDIGAGIGTETLPFSGMVGDSGKVVAVEAHPATFDMLERACRLNDLRNVELVHAAVMDSDEPVMISDLRAGFCQENRIGSEGIPVRAVTISELVSNLDLNRIDFLKMNIEGAEVGALRGARDVLPIVRHAAIGCHDFLADETGDDSYRTMDVARALLEEAGFSVTRPAEDPRPWAAHYLFASR
ncbi:MAG: FkbM family methyltransferase [Mycolicibacterium sp.]|uniref:FkbM family methyltransferase n=1 Tax=Mycolicibacterium sp. TaxID=2320850 RepID=UPI003D12E85C